MNTLYDIGYQTGYSDAKTEKDESAEGYSDATTSLIYDEVREYE